MKHSHDEFIIDICCDNLGLMRRIPIGRFLKDGRDDVGGGK